MTSRTVRTCLVGLVIALIVLCESPGQAQAQPPGFQYTVQSGDTLFQMANRFGTSASLIIKHNGLESDVIWPDEVLWIPGPPRPYTVQAGDTLYQIAQNYGTTVNAIMTGNSLRSDALEVGQTLSIDVKGNERGQYVVMKGDTLSAIARNYGVSVQELRDFNDQYTDTIYVGEVLVIPNYQTFYNTLVSKGTSIPEQSLAMLIDKTDHTLSLYANETWIKTYHVEFGMADLGDKERRGDHETPEGSFYVTERLQFLPPDPDVGSRWFRLSYPNIEDATRGINEGIIAWKDYNNISYAISNMKTPPQDTALGGGIGVHGGTTASLGSNWTWGCIGLRNEDIEDFYPYVVLGTPVIIRK